eukprot:357916-Chlamydomonas_euryale.AAC.6
MLAETKCTLVITMLAERQSQKHSHVAFTTTQSAPGAIMPLIIAKQLECPTPAAWIRPPRPGSFHVEYRSLDLAHCDVCFATAPLPQSDYPVHGSSNASNPKLSLHSVPLTQPPTPRVWT